MRDPIHAPAAPPVVRLDRWRRTRREADLPSRRAILTSGALFVTLSWVAVIGTMIG